MQIDRGDVRDARIRHKAARQVNTEQPYDHARQRH